MQPDDPRLALDPTRNAGWEAALREIEHQALHWDTPEHGDIGRLIAEALRSAVAIARAGGLDCEHRAKRPPATSC
jgi:hypothetical protein